MRKFGLLLMVFFASHIHAQVCNLGQSQPGVIFNRALNHSPSPAANAVMSAAMQAICTGYCGQINFHRNHSTPNARAETVGPNLTEITYNPNFMNTLMNTFGSEAAFAVLAHEYGHHIDFFTTPPWANNSWSRELKADAWAGCALARSGYGTAQINSALQAIASYPSPSHPGWLQRQAAVRQGFVGCGGNWTF